MSIHLLRHNTITATPINIYHTDQLDHVFGALASKVPSGDRGTTDAASFKTVCRRMLSILIGRNAANHAVIILRDYPFPIVCIESAMLSVPIAAGVKNYLPANETYTSFLPCPGQFYLDNQRRTVILIGSNDFPDIAETYLNFTFLYEV